MSELYKKIYELVRSIPPGKVSTYGQIARLTGNPRRSRIVGYAMASCGDSSVPCHRVIHSDGRLPKTFGFAGNALQKALLEAEGIDVSEDFRVDLDLHLWQTYQV